MEELNFVMLSTGIESILLSLFTIIDHFGRTTINKLRWFNRLDSALRSFEAIDRQPCSAFFEGKRKDVATKLSDIQIRKLYRFCESVMVVVAQRRGLICHTVSTECFKSRIWWDEIPSLYRAQDEFSWEQGSLILV